MRIYRSIVLPAIMPELGASVILTLGLAWSTVIGAEYIGLDSGIGRVLIFAQFFSNTGRMTLITLLIILYATISYALFHRVASRILRWMPSSAFADAAVVRTAKRDDQ